MKIGVIGGGVVGRATARTYLEWADEVRVYDVIPERATHTLQQVKDCGIVFLCLPTPESKDGSGECDLSSLYHFFENEKGSAVPYVIKSTVPIGTTKRLANLYGIRNLCHSPEFLTARCAEVDAKIPGQNIVGRVSQDYDFASYNLACLYEKRFPGVAIRYMISDESEAVKLMLNSFFAVKVAFFNEMSVLARALSLNWETVLTSVLADGRITANHTRVPGPDGKYGFGGTCLPKDLASMVCHLRSSGITPHVTNAALTRNRDDRLR